MRIPFDQQSTRRPRRNEPTDPVSMIRRPDRASFVGPETRRETVDRANRPASPITAVRGPVIRR